MSLGSPEEVCTKKEEDHSSESVILWECPLNIIKPGGDTRKRQVCGVMSSGRDYDTKVIQTATETSFNVAERFWCRGHEKITSKGYRHG